MGMAKIVVERNGELHDPVFMDKPLTAWVELLLNGELVEVVRCKDCKYFIEPTATDGLCELDGNHRIIWRNDDFCSYGERKDNE